jgi:TatD DNase family protein
MSGIAAFPKSQELRDIFASAPVDRILVETDSPYLAPPPHRGRRNEPAYTAHTAKIGAEVFGLSYEDFAAQTSANFDRLFAKAAGWSL